MRLVREAVGSVSSPLSEVNADCECSGTRGDVNGCSASKVETAHDEGPTVGVPGPAGDRVVYDGRPDEDEYEGWAESCALSDGTESEHGGDGGEHELEDAECDGGNASGSNGGLLKDTLQAEIFQVADVGIASLAECKRVAVGTL